MNDNKEAGKGDDRHQGAPGKAAHGGDIAPPNSDDAGKRQSPESGPPSPPNTDQRKR